jgi:hypothetical protein
MVWCSCGVCSECRERWGYYTCDGRRPIREIIKEFPDFDFANLEVRGSVRLALLGTDRRSD